MYKQIHITNTNLKEENNNTIIVSDFNNQFSADYQD